jgi:hypothetical protein
MLGLIAYNRIGGVMVSVLAMRVVDHGFVSKSGKTKDYKIDFCCFFGKHPAFLVGFVLFVLLVLVLCVMFCRSLFVLLLLAFVLCVLLRFTDSGYLQTLLSSLHIFSI